MPTPSASHASWKSFSTTDFNTSPVFFVHQEASDLAIGLTHECDSPSENVMSTEVATLADAGVPALEPETARTDPELVVAVPSGLSPPPHRCHCRCMDLRPPFRI